MMSDSTPLSSLPARCKLKEEVRRVVGHKAGILVDVGYNLMPRAGELLVRVRVRGGIPGRRGPADPGDHHSRRTRSSEAKRSPLSWYGRRRDRCRPSTSLVQRPCPWSNSARQPERARPAKAWTPNQADRALPGTGPSRFRAHRRDEEHVPAGRGWPRPSGPGPPWGIDSAVRTNGRAPGLGIGHWCRTCSRARSCWPYFAKNPTRLDSRSDPRLGVSDGADAASCCSRAAHRSATRTALPAIRNGGLPAIRDHTANAPASDPTGGGSRGREHVAQMDPDPPGQHRDLLPCPSCPRSSTGTAGRREKNSDLSLRPYRRPGWLRDAFLGAGAPESASASQSAADRSEGLTARDDTLRDDDQPRLNRCCAWAAATRRRNRSPPWSRLRPRSRTPGGQPGRSKLPGPPVASLRRPLFPVPGAWRCFGAPQLTRPS